MLNNAQRAAVWLSLLAIMPRRAWVSSFGNARNTKLRLEIGY